MITVIIPKPGSTYGKAHTWPVRVITRTEAATVTKVLASQGLRVELTEPDGLGVVHVWAKDPIGTEGEVRVLRAVESVTDAPLAWHPASGEVQ